MMCWAVDKEYMQHDTGVLMHTAWLHIASACSANMHVCKCSRLHSITYPSAHLKPFANTHWATPSFHSKSAACSCFCKNPNLVQISSTGGGSTQLNHLFFLWVAATARSCTGFVVPVKHRPPLSWSPNQQRWKKVDSSVKTCTVGAVWSKAKHIMWANFVCLSHMFHQADNHIRLNHLVMFQTPQHWVYQHGACKYSGATWSIHAYVLDVQFYVLVVQQSAAPQGAYVGRYQTCCITNVL